MEKIQESLIKIFYSAVNSVNPDKLIKNCLKLENDRLTISAQNNTQKKIITLNLRDFKNIFVIGAGKASGNMAKALENILGDRITSGIISVKHEHNIKLKNIELIKSGHPEPDENSLKSAIEIEKIAEKADSKSLIINLLSGGGSALVTSPYKYSDKNINLSLSLRDSIDTIKVLLKCGANINEINCIRKHISCIKGGRLANIIYPGKSINLILSDVIGNSIDTIASGLTVFDPTTYSKAGEIISKYKIKAMLPKKVIQIINAGIKGQIPETPKEKNIIFEQTENFLIGTNLTALLAGEKTAKILGFKTMLLSSHLTGEAVKTAEFLSGIAYSVKKHNIPASPPVCILTGGETTVKITGKGKGGRNQEMALGFLNELKKMPEISKDIYFLSAATDGNDGPTDAAGAFANNEIIKKALKTGLNINKYLKNNDSYNFFNKLGCLFKPGATGTNVCDIQIMIIT